MNTVRDLSIPATDFEGILGENKSYHMSEHKVPCQVALHQINPKTSNTGKRSSNKCAYTKKWLSYHNYIAIATSTQLVYNCNNLHDKRS